MHTCVIYSVVYIYTVYTICTIYRRQDTICVHENRKNPFTKNMKSGDFDITQQQHNNVALTICAQKQKQNRKKSFIKNTKSGYVDSPNTIKPRRQ